MVIVAALLGLSGMMVQSASERATAEAETTRSPASTYRLSSL
jgi:hypothetical protein